MHLSDVAYPGFEGCVGDDLGGVGVEGVEVDEVFSTEDVGGAGVSLVVNLEDAVGFVFVDDDGAYATLCVVGKKKHPKSFNNLWGAL